MNFEPPRYACEGMLWFILFFAPAAFGSTEWWSRAVLESLIFGLAAMCALRRDFFSPLNAPLMGFGVIIALGVLQLLQQSPLAGPAGLLPSTLSRPQTLYALLLWAALAALLWSASGILRWEGALRRLAWVIFASGLFISVVGILQRGQGNTAYYGLRPIRNGLPFGPFTNYNHAAAWVVASTLVGAGLFADGFQRYGRVPLSERVAKQILIAFVLGVSVSAVLAIGSRGGLNSLCVAALASAFLFSRSLAGGRPLRLLWGALVLAGGAYVIFLFKHPQELGIVGGALESSAATRVSLYRSGLRLLADFPFFGAGLGTFTGAFRPYQDPAFIEIVDHVHSSWFEIALESGLLGFCVFAAAILKPLAACGRRLTAADLPTRGMAAGFFAALLAFTLHGFVEFSFQIPATAVLAIVLLAAVAALRLSSEPEQGGVRSRRAALAGAFAVLALLSLPPGFSGAGPRLGAPFLFASDTLIAGDKK
ncbi:MAG: O-antigen ligase family protein [Oligoflexia bacterium]|nr:O-antigen ligase family protein [Oligoflexia bacterium]